MLGIQFYPTPKHLAYKLIKKLDFSRVHSLLEPSAGKGDFIDSFLTYRTEEMKTYTLQRCRDKRNDKMQFFDTKTEVFAYIKQEFGQEFTDIEPAKKYLDSLEDDDGWWQLSEHEMRDSKNLVDITCVEIDADLCSILKGRHRLAINADFLNWCSFTHYDTVLMNPPFADGEKHLLKAISLCENGGQICCILNAETIHNPYTNLRQLLVQKLDEYHAEIEYVADAFADAERTADVDVALIYINIPCKVISEEVAKGFVKGDIYEKEYHEFKEAQLYNGDAISLLIEQFNLEARYGIKLIDTFLSMQQYVPDNMISLSVTGCTDEGSKVTDPRNKYIRKLRQKYWELAFQTTQISELLTDSARERYQHEILRFRDYDFTLSNIKQLQIELSQSLDKNIHDAIVNLYDSFTYKYSRENPTNVHLFNGWNTNQGFKINPKKIIYPLYLYTTYGGWGSWDVYRLRDFLTEVEKVFIYLDGGRTDGESVSDILTRLYYKSNTKYCGENLSFKYFDVEVKKKGTIHIKWKCDELVKKLTIIGCKAHGTLPNDYGSKRYDDLDEAYKKTVDEFEGRTEYSDTVSNAKLYLETSAVKLISTK